MSSNISADLVYQSPSFSMNFMNIIDEIPLVVNCYFPYVLFCALVKGGGEVCCPEASCKTCRPDPLCYPLCYRCMIIVHQNRNWIKLDNYE